LELDIDYKYTFVKKETYIYTALTCLLMLVTGCDSGNPGLCFDGSDPIVERFVVVDVFDKIIVRDNIQMILSEGPQSVRIETAASIIEDVEVTVVDGTLTLIDENRCDLLEASEATLVYVSAPDIRRIRNASQYEVSSEGVLGYESLILVSDENENSKYRIADFRLNLAVGGLEVISNNFSNFYISGTAERALIGFYGGAGRFEGVAFFVEELNVFHRGSNVMIVYPVNSIKGKIVSNGDIIAKNQPDIVEVEERYTGRLIFD
jgi:hypothetical protein